MESPAENFARLPLIEFQEEHSKAKQNGKQLPCSFLERYQIRYQTKLPKRICGLPGAEEDLYVFYAGKDHQEFGQRSTRHFSLAHCLRVSIQKQDMKLFDYLLEHGDRRFGGLSGPIAIPLFRMILRLNNASWVEKASKLLEWIQESPPYDFFTPDQEDLSGLSDEALTAYLDLSKPSNALGYFLGKHKPLALVKPYIKVLCDSDADFGPIGLFVGLMESRDLQKIDLAKRRLLRFIKDNSKLPSALLAICYGDDVKAFAAGYQDQSSFCADGSVLEPLIEAGNVECLQWLLEKNGHDFFQRELDLTSPPADIIHSTWEYRWSISAQRISRSLSFLEGVDPSLLTSKGSTTIHRLWAIIGDPQIVEVEMLRVHRLEWRNYGLLLHQHGHFDLLERFLRAREKGLYRELRVPEHCTEILVFYIDRSLPLDTLKLGNVDHWSVKDWQKIARASCLIESLFGVWVTPTKSGAWERCIRETLISHCRKIVMLTVTDSSPSPLPSPILAGFVTSSRNYKMHYIVLGANKEVFCKLCEQIAHLQYQMLETRGLAQQEALHRT